MTQNYIGPAMYNGLYIPSGAKTFYEFVQHTVPEYFPPGWSVRQDEFMDPRTQSLLKFLIFSCDSTFDVHLCFKSDLSYGYVSNISPISVERLTPEEYNQCLDIFVHQIIDWFTLKNRDPNFMCKYHRNNMSNQETLDAAKKKYNQLLADFDNYRRRTEKQHAELVDSANQKLLGQFTEIYDDLDRAFGHVLAQDGAEQIAVGLKQIFVKFKGIMAKNGVEQFDPAGEVFDPHRHEAVMQQPSNTVSRDSILTVYQKGYMIGEKVLKPAKVVVSSGPPT